MKDVPIGEVLKEYGYITEENIQEALEYQKTEAGNGKRLGTLLQELGFVTEMQVLESLGKKLELPLINIEEYNINLEASEKIPKQLAVKYNVLPLSQNNNKFQLAVSDPLNFYAQEDIHQIVGAPLEIMIAESSAIRRMIDYNYAEISAKIAARKANISVKELKVPAIEIEDGDDEVPVINLVNSLLARGYSINASDIHIEPFEAHTQIRMRIDGMIVDYVTIAKSLHSSIAARVKIMGNMDIAEKRVPQDGNFRTIVGDFDISIRVSVIPTIYGEKVVMRYLTSDTAIDKAGYFGMETDAYEKICRMLQAPNGIIYITGPTGSGKTTTLYMVLEYLAKRQVNISTIEDPVERGIPGINQMSVNKAAGLTFSTGLRAILRQDPDIIMLGETRDTETAEISVRAAITGHLVVSTLHTNDAVSSIVRLEDMGIAPYLLANSLVGIVAQRLVRKVCDGCAYETEPSPEESAIIGTHIKTVRKGRGCHVCNNTGYKGRVAIHEILMIDKTLKRMITGKADSQDMFEYAVRNQNMKTLRETAINLVERGITTPEEVLRASYYSD